MERTEIHELKASVADDHHGTINRIANMDNLHNWVTLPPENDTAMINNNLLRSLTAVHYILHKDVSILIPN